MAAKIMRSIQHKRKKGFKTMQRLAPPVARHEPISTGLEEVLSDGSRGDSHHSDGHHGDSGVLVLNHNYEPLNICAIRRGLVLMQLDKVEVLRFSENTLKSAEDEFLVPSVLRLRDQVKRPTPQLKISRKSIMARDGYMCQYCSSKSVLTIDHVFPRHRGGETTWENVVCCCLRCNNKKGARTPSEAGMRLPHPPRKPHYTPYISFPRFVSAVRRAEWREYLEGYGKGLER